MKKFFSFLLCLSILVVSASAYTISSEVTMSGLSMEEVSCISVSARSGKNNYVVSAIKDYAEIKNVVEKGDILVVPLDAAARNGIEEDIGLPFSVEDTNPGGFNSGLRLYLKTNGIYSVMDVCSDEECIESSNLNQIIKDMEITSQENIELTNQVKSQKASTVYDIKFVGKYSTSVTQESCGKVAMTYAVFSLKDYDSSKNYFSVSALINGNSGIALTEGGSSLNWEAYQSEYMKIVMARSSSSIVFEDASPESTNGQSLYSYSVSRTLEFGLLGDPAINTSATSEYGVTRTVNDTEIAMYQIGENASWDLQYSGNATKSTNTIQTAANFRCPTTLSQPQFSITIDYSVVKKLGPLVTSRKVLSSNKTITVKTTSISVA